MPHESPTEQVAPGQRVFDIALQGRVVLKGFDICKEAGGPNCALLKEFRGVATREVLTLAFTPAAVKVTPATAPIISGLEIIAEQE